MADKRPGDPVQFTYESAERIADVVRAAETAGPPSAPLTFEPRLTNRVPRQVRAAKFNGTWPVGVSKVVLLSNTPTATAAVMNLSWPLNFSYTNEDCIVGKDGTAWYLVVPRLEAKTAVMVSRTVRLDVLTGITVTGSFDGTACSVTVSATTSGTTLVTIATSFTSEFYRARVP